MLVPAQTRASSEWLSDTLPGLERPERQQERAREVTPPSGLASAKACSSAIEKAPVAGSYSTHLPTLPAQPSGDIAGTSAAAGRQFAGGNGPGG